MKRDLFTVLAVVVGVILSLAVTGLGIYVIWTAADAVLVKTMVTIILGVSMTFLTAAFVSVNLNL